MQSFDRTSRCDIGLWSDPARTVDATGANDLACRPLSIKILTSSVPHPALSTSFWQCCTAFFRGHAALWLNRIRETMFSQSRTTRRLLRRSPKTRRKVSILDNNTYIPAVDSKIELESRQASLIEVVQSLGEYINSEDGKVRARAVSYLTAIISALSPTFLTRQQIQVITDFFSARIEDGGAIEGLSKLQGSSRFTKDMAQSVVKA